jgi:hypothetical protein
VESQPVRALRQIRQALLVLLNILFAVIPEAAFLTAVEVVRIVWGLFPISLKAVQVLPRRRATSGADTVYSRGSDGRAFMACQPQPPTRHLAAINPRLYPILLRCHRWGTPKYHMYVKLSPFITTAYSIQQTANEASADATAEIQQRHSPA